MRGARFADRYEKTRLSAAYGEDGTAGVMIHLDGGKGGILMSELEPGVPVLRITDRYGKDKMQMLLDQDGAARVVVANPKGTQTVRIHPDAEGDSRITIEDEAGNELFSAPRDQRKIGF